ncbi:non-homologous end-joining DNA ligase [Brevibacterium marinum]|uniref:Bifunctional non-homologous end joining protein LigD n=1 Tax=Brevibacterium marinum TaxID=418643 RepID=A0A846S4Y8_9MICO|nr:non-homologous end-joining DNA ligase [Brevibacterium marinum]NJC58083.1 bifunctional non-homologous end joining protein LigD [Brevibacterium marinum]
MSSSAEVSGVSIDKADKEMFGSDDGGPITKADLAKYYADVAEVMLPHIRDRPISMQRFPDGVGSEWFYEKKYPEHFPEFVESVRVATMDGEQNQVMIDNARTLVYLVDQACITPHTWLATSADLDHPDQLIVDLDPSVPGIAAVRRATVMVGELMDELGLNAFVKTTGSRGYHVQVPLIVEHDFDEVRDFARNCARVLVDRDPELLTIEARKNKRGDRVLVDIARIAYAQTAVPPYAVRSRPGAPVATPITWDELSSIDPQDYTMKSVRNRLAQRADPWNAMARHRQGIAKPMEIVGKL